MLPLYRAKTCQISRLILDFTQYIGICILLFTVTFGCLRIYDITRTDYRELEAAANNNRGSSRDETTAKRHRHVWVYFTRYVACSSIGKKTVLLVFPAPLRGRTPFDKGRRNAGIWGSLDPDFVYITSSNGKVSAELCIAD